MLPEAMIEFTKMYERHPFILTEGAIGERMKHEYGLYPDTDIMFAALLYSFKGKAALEEIYRQYLSIAEKYEVPIMLMTNTRRANKERVHKSEYQKKSIMLDYALFLGDMIRNYNCQAYIGGLIGCKNDAYSGDCGLSYEEAIQFHSWQVDAFSEPSIDYFIAGILPSIEEAMGIATLLEKTNKPYFISFMINREGTLLDGTTIHDAIIAIDSITARKPLCYMSNCVHPIVLREALRKPVNVTQEVKKRFGGLQANASYMLPSVLDGSNSLFASDPVSLLDDIESVYTYLPLKIIGGCCGTDNRHIEEIAKRYCGYSATLIT